MRCKRLASGQEAYYWGPRSKDLKNGFPLVSEALGCDYGAAKARADHLNTYLDNWRRDKTADKSLDLSPNFGTVDWWFETYFRSHAFRRLSDRTHPGYRWHLQKIASIETDMGGRLGDLRASSITPAAVDKIYARLTKTGTYRTANNVIDTGRMAWRVVQRAYPKQFVDQNPFAGVLRTHKSTSIVAATREQVLALADAIERTGHLHLAVAPLVCFDWLQRPENLIAGYLKWCHYRPSGRPGHVMIRHHKNDVDVWHPLEDEDGPFYPELEARLSALSRLGVPVVVTPGGRGTPHTYSRGYAQRIVRNARIAAGLPDHLTLTACRHGGMTELGDAELTEQGIMSLSGHTRPDAARRYVKKTEHQRLAASRRRRAWRHEQEQLGNESRNGRREESRNELS